MLCVAHPLEDVPCFQEATEFVASVPVKEQEVLAPTMHMIAPLVGAFMGPKTLATSTMVCRRWLIAFAGNSLWFNLAVRRWGFNSRYRPPTLYGSTTWKGAFSNMAWRQRLPRGKYTRNKVIVFGKGRVRNVDMWVMIAHANNCSTKRAIFVGGERKVEQCIELRVVVQNVEADEVLIRPEEIQVLRKPSCAGWETAGGTRYPRFVLHSKGEGGASMDDEHKFEQLDTCDFPRILARNGEATSELVEDLEGKCCVLRPLGHVVISILVRCPGCDFETDFLCQSQCVRVPVTVRNGSSTSESLVRAAFMDEKYLSEHFNRLPGGCMVLIEREDNF
ncbi:unnamed protein product [Chrysoparadoxa australica]